MKPKTKNALLKRIKQLEEQVKGHQMHEWLANKKLLAVRAELQELEGKTINQ